MAYKAKKPLERELYKPVKEYLEARFKESLTHCYLEITSEGKFSQELKRLIPHDIIFSFLGKQASPDLVGFTWTTDNLWLFLLPIARSGVKDFITVEIKREPITLKDVYQAKMYGDLFRAKYALLISPEPIPEEIKRLHRRVFVLYRVTDWKVYIGSWNESTNAVESWFPEAPFGSWPLRTWLAPWTPPDKDKKP